MELLKKLGMRCFIICTALLLAGVAMTACDDDDDDDGGADSRYVGVWASADDIDSGRSSIFAIELKADGTGRDGEWDASALSFIPEESVWHWRIDGNMIYITDTDGSTSSTSFTLSSDGRTGTLGGTDVYVKVK